MLPGAQASANSDGDSYSIPDPDSGCPASILSAPVVIGRNKV